jgi:uncharacterized protein YjbI with pentapeptide repeats
MNFFQIERKKKMSNPEIRNRFTEKVIIKAGRKYNSIKKAIEINKANLWGADLWGADLRGADLREADLREADLRGADLRGADLREADLREADLREADLRGANLGRADLGRADLGRADLKGANLGRADLKGANLWGADLRGADLRGADLRGADLREADLRGANSDFSSFPLWCGSFNMKVDDRLIWQLICHITRLDISGCGKEAQKAVFSLSRWRNKFCKYRGDVGKIKPIKQD